MHTVKILLEEQGRTIAMLDEAQAKMNIVKASLSQSIKTFKAKQIENRNRFEEEIAPINDKIKVFFKLKSRSRGLGPHEYANAYEHVASLSCRARHHHPRSHAQLFAGVARALPHQQGEHREADRRERRATDG